MWCCACTELVSTALWCDKGAAVSRVQSHQFLSPTLTRFPWQHNKQLWPQKIPDSKWLIRVTVTIWWLLIYLSASISLFFKLPFLFLFFSSFPCLLSCFGGVATCSHLWTEWGVRAPLVWDQNLTFTSSTETGMNSFFWNGLFYKNTCLFPAAPPALSAE